MFQLSSRVGFTAIAFVAIFGIGTASVIPASGATAPAAPTGTPAFVAVAVPVNVKIPTELTQQVSSLTAHVGDTFAFRTLKDETLGTIVVPAGTPGHGRVAVAAPAHDRAQGQMALQADSLDLPDGRTISVNIDTSKPIRGYLSDKHTHFTVLPIPIGIVPIIRSSRSGNLVLDPGATFAVLTTLPRTVPAPLLTASPQPTPTATAQATSAPTAAPADSTPSPGSPTARPSVSPTL